MTEWVLPLLVGTATGILSAWGVGGGTLLLLVMTLFLGVDQRMAQGINLLYFLPTAGAGLLFHRKTGMLDRQALRQAIPWGVVTAALGAWAATAMDTAVLRKPFGVYLLVMTLFLGVDQRTAQGINLLYFLPTAGAGLLFHRKAGMLDKQALRQAIPWGVATAALGAWCATAMDTELLRRPFGVYLLVMGVITLIKKPEP